MRRRWFLLLTLLAFALALAAGGLLWQAVETSSVSAMQTRVEAMKPVFTGIRLVLIALVALAWPVVTKRLYRRGRIDAAQATTMRALRWRLVTWLVVIELVLGQNLLGQVLARCCRGVGHERRQLSRTLHHPVRLDLLWHPLGCAGRHRHRVPALPGYPHRQLARTGRRRGVRHGHRALAAAHGAGTVHRAAGGGAGRPAGGVDTAQCGGPPLHTAADADRSDTGDGHGRRLPKHLWVDRLHRVAGNGEPPGVVVRGALDDLGVQSRGGRRPAERGGPAHL